MQNNINNSPTPKKGSSISKFRSSSSWKKGQSGNPNGRPPKGQTVKDLLNCPRKSSKMVKKLFKVANTLGTKKEHKYALQAQKMLLDKMIPDLKSESLEIKNVEPGYVMLPQPKNAITGEFEEVKSVLIPENTDPEKEFKNDEK
mgnify:CR=1 FL=1|tara:strand:+ start:383 stop:814 length:432 start_codon:yes stop_codon:yes gene_type:complete